MRLTDIILPQDRLYPSDNEYEIPLLRFDRQPRHGLLLPFAPWGTCAGVSECPDRLLDELEAAKETSGCETPNLIVYGGGRQVREICQSHQLLYVEQHMVRMRESRKEVRNG